MLQLVCVPPALVEKVRLLLPTLALAPRHVRAPVRTRVLIAPLRHQPVQFQFLDTNLLLAIVLLALILLLLVRRVRLWLRLDTRPLALELTSAMPLTDR